MREMSRAYGEREDDGTDAFSFLAFDPSNADKIFTEAITDRVLTDLGEGESVFEKQGETVVKYSKLNGRLYKEDTTLTEV